MNITDFRKITIGVLQGYFSNKSVLDKFGESNGSLVYDGQPIEAETIDAYTKTETNALLNAKANVSTTYTKTEVDSALDLKADLADVIDNTVDNLTNYYKKTETYTKDEVNALVEAIPQLELEVVASLPTTDISTSTIYLVRNSETTGENLYDEYLRISNAWECIGKVNTSVDLSTLTDYVAKADVNYATTADITTIVNKYQFGGSGSGSGGSTGLPVLFSEAGTERQVGWYENSNGLRKPVYQKNIAGTLNTMIDVSALSIDKMIYMYAIAVLVNGNYSVVPNSAVLEFFYSPSQNGIRSDTTNTYYKDRPYTCTIQYTKTTDTFQ